MRDLYSRIRSFQHAGIHSQKPCGPAEGGKPAHSRLSSLAQLPGILLARDLAARTRAAGQDRDRFLASVGGCERVARGGSFWLRQVTCTSRRIYRAIQDMDGHIVARLGRDETLHALDPRNTLFIDAETTGLAGGTGTYAFLVGVGRWTDDGFVVAQYLMRDYDEEPALLEMLVEDLRSAQAVVTFNGKCFDIPLLSTRLRMNRYPPILERVPHFDLLFPARRLWRYRCGHCDLSTLESVVLGRSRKGDVPSHLIPYIYFDFLRGIGIERMKAVLEHNVTDVVSLVELAAKACRLYRSPQSETDEPLDWLSLARSFFVERDYEKAGLLLEKSLRFDLPAGFRRAAQREYSLILKRRGDYRRATRVWREMLDCDGGFDLCPYEELAKYYEHIAGDLKQAQLIVEQALARLDSVSYRVHDQVNAARIKAARASLKHRLKRLTRKVDTANRGR